MKENGKIAKLKANRKGLETAASLQWVRLVSFLTVWGNFWPQSQGHLKTWPSYLHWGASRYFPHSASPDAQLLDIPAPWTPDRSHKGSHLPIACGAQPEPCVEEAVKQRKPRPSETVGRITAAFKVSWKLGKVQLYNPSLALAALGRKPPKHRHWPRFTVSALIPPVEQAPVQSADCSLSHSSHTFTPEAHLAWQAGRVACKSHSWIWLLMAPPAPNPQHPT